MGGLKDGVGRFASEFESGLLNLLGFYLVVVTAAVCAVGGALLAQWAWPRVAWIDTTLVVAGIAIGGSLGILAISVLHERLPEGGKSWILWTALSLIPGAGVLIAIVDICVRAMKRWSRSDDDSARSKSER